MKQPDNRTRNRRSIRLKEYDYSQAGYYYITICTHNREHLFGAIENGVMRHNDIGTIALNEWTRTPEMRPNISLDAFVVMPNHFHGIIIIGDIDVGMEISDVVGNSSDVRAGLEPAPTEPMSSTGIMLPISPTFPTPPKQHGLPEIVRQLKTFSARRINQMRGTPGVPVWQRNYYERIIRDDIELYHVRQYIMNNPKNWKSDENYYD